MKKIIGILCVVAQLQSIELNNIVSQPQVFLGCNNDTLVHIDSTKWQDSDLINNVLNNQSDQHLPMYINVFHDQKYVSRFRDIIQSGYSIHPCLEFYEIAYCLHMKNAISELTKDLIEVTTRLFDDSECMDRGEAVHTFVTTVDDIQSKQQRLEGPEAHMTLINAWLNHPYKALRCSESIIRALEAETIYSMNDNYKILAFSDKFIIRTQQDENYYSHDHILSFEDPSSIFIIADKILAVRNHPHSDHAFFIMTDKSIVLFNNNQMKTLITLEVPVHCMEYNHALNAWFTLNAHGSVGRLSEHHEQWTYEADVIRKAVPDEKYNTNRSLLCISPSGNLIGVAKPAYYATDAYFEACFELFNVHRAGLSCAITLFKCNDSIDAMHFIGENDIAIVSTDYNVAVEQLINFWNEDPAQYNKNILIVQKQSTHRAFTALFGQKRLQLHDSNTKKIVLELDNIDDFYLCSDGRLMINHNSTIYKIDLDNVDNFFRKTSANLKFFDLLRLLYYYNIPLINHAPNIIKKIAHLEQSFKESLMQVKNMDLTWMNANFYYQ